MNREEYQNDKRIAIYGSPKDIQTAIEILENSQYSADVNEYDARLILQSIIDDSKMKAELLFGGNNVYSFDKTIRDFKQALNSKPCPIHEGVLIS